jgi:hypothetical protein
MARFVESMRDEAEERAKTGVHFDPSVGDDISLEPVSESDTVIHHGSEPPSEVSSSLDASGHFSISLNTSGSLASPKVAAQEPEMVEESITAHIVAHEESTPNFSLDDHDVSNMDDHSEDILAHSNITADSGISQSYDRQADNFIEEIDSAFDSINFDIQSIDKMGATTTVPVKHHTNLNVDTELDLRDDLSKGTVSDIDTPPIREGGRVDVLDTEYDGDVSADNGVMDIVITPKVDKNINLESEPVMPRMVNILARAESPIMVEVGPKRVESPTMVAVGAGVKPSGHIVHDSSPELPKRLVLESSPKDVVIESKQKENLSDSFGVKLRHKVPESNVIFESDQDVPNADEPMVKVRTKEKKIERVSIVKPAPVRDSKVFTIGKDDEVFDFEKIRQRALAAQKEKKSGLKKHYGVAGSRPKSEIQKQTTEISFKPNVEGEAEHVLEEKSIMMMSRPIEMKSVEVKVHKPNVLHPKMVEPDPEPQTVKFKFHSLLIRNHNQRMCP